MIEAIGLSKRYGHTVAVDDLSFTVPPGQVTGFLGPNGAGKSTTMRMILGLDAPTSGTVTVNGRPYADYRRPLFEVGALLDAKAMHGGRSASNHLLCLALSNGIGRARVSQ
ncbi:MAG: ATP-binding cassette domain-containing protein, partial [Candidatus Dormibacteraeota bacterium]|nr:ATP-binding cassette domain-containing protein [Candidatus Dormibacteraeota bacterium]